MARKLKSLPQSKGAFSIYILVDGETEQDYLKSIKTTKPYCDQLGNQRITIRPEIPSKKSLDDQYDSLKEALNHYDRVIWLVDYDVINLQQSQHRKPGTVTPKQKFIDLSSRLESLTKIKKYKGKTVHILINNPSIEYWYLLHYKDTSRLYTTSLSVENELKNYISDYTKNNEKYRKSILGKLNEKIDHAIFCAKKLNDDNNNVIARADIYKIFDKNLELLKP